MSDMIEKVAKALYEHWFIGEWPPETDPELNMGAEDFRAAASAAIEAMREPTEDMKNCSDNIHWTYSCHVCGGLQEGWVAMFDAALQKRKDRL